MPVAAPKYEFTRNLAEKMLQQSECCSSSSSISSDSIEVNDIQYNWSRDCEDQYNIRNNVAVKDVEQQIRRRRRAAMEVALQAAFERAVRVLRERLEKVQEERVKDGEDEIGDGEGGGWGRRRRRGSKGRSWWWWRRWAAAMGRTWKYALRRAAGILFCGAMGSDEEQEFGENSSSAMAALLGFILEEAGELMAHYFEAAPPMAAIGDDWEGRRRRLRSLEAAEASAEKAAHELLWLVRLIQTSSENRTALMHDASLTWSSVGRRLPALSVYSPLPRVQACLVRVCDLLFKELNHKSMEEHDKLINGGNHIMSLKAKLLVMWLPLFCNVRNSHDNPSFSPCEKLEILSNLEHMVGSLAFWEQEIVLSCWLQLYTRSPYDWPNLQNCFQTWLSHHQSLTSYE